MRHVGGKASWGWAAKGALRQYMKRRSVTAINVSVRDDGRVGSLVFAFYNVHFNGKVESL